MSGPAAGGDGRATFLVEARVALPAALGDAERAELLAAEHARGVELARAGVIAGIWRLPGATANVAIWRVADADELHRLLSALPLARWMTFTVTALATHPIAEALRDAEAADG